MLRRFINYLAELPQRKIDNRRKEYDDFYRAEGYKEPEFIKLSPRANKTSKTTEHNTKRNSSGTSVYESNNSNIMANVIYSSALADTASDNNNNCSHTDSNMTSGSTDSSSYCD